MRQAFMRAREHECISIADLLQRPRVFERAAERDARCDLESRDFVAVQGIVVLLAVIVALTNFIVDIIAAFIDPRVRY